MSFSGGFSTPVQEPVLRKAVAQTKQADTVSNAIVFKLASLLFGIILLGFAATIYGPGIYKSLNAPIPEFTEKHVQLVNEANVIDLAAQYNGAGKTTLVKRGEKFEFEKIRPLSKVELATLKDRCKKLITKMPPAYVIRASLRASLMSMHTELRSGLGPSPSESAASAALRCYRFN